jgi:glycosyltransferase involved in cell wall biosynthesis
MKIAQVAPLWESVPPVLYGGTERIVSCITEELVRQGHEVTLFASGDSTTSARLMPMCAEALRSTKVVMNYEAPLTAMVEKVFSAAADFDLIHSHLEFIPFPLARRCRTPMLTTLHARLDQPELVPVFRKFADLPLVSVSNAQREPLDWVNWQATIHPGLPTQLYAPQEDHGRYLLFLGRVAPEKGLDRAIELATRVDMPLRIAAKVDGQHAAYFTSVIEPLLAHPLVEFVGEVTDIEKEELLGHAYALLAPYAWPEPFGLALVEALACGTPVIGARCGAIPEIVEHGVTGFICDNLDDMVQSIRHVPLLKRARCRQSFELRFSAERMAQEYLAVYENLLGVSAKAPERTASDLASGVTPSTQG